MHNKEFLYSPASKTHFINRVEVGHYNDWWLNFVLKRFGYLQHLFRALKLAAWIELGL